MNGNSAALDTNAAVAINNNQSKAVEWVRNIDQVFLPVPVLAELLFGALNSRDVTVNRARIEELAKRCVILGTDHQTAKVYSSLRLELKKAGRPIPENDLWISAICVQYGVPICTRDSHFANVPGLTVIHLDAP